MPDQIYRFGPFRLDIGERQLLLDDETITLQGKVFDTLRVLVENPGHLLRKDELMRTVWPDSVVEENNLDRTISVIRKTLGRRHSELKYVETVPRQGYRFVVPVQSACAASPATKNKPATLLVEREGQLLQLRQALESANSATRQVALITGEPGIGKTALVRAFIDELSDSRTTRVATGNCQDRHGEGEPYMPVLEALGRLAREEGDFLRAVLARCAPSWLARLPSITAAADPAPPQPAALGVTTARMLREMSDAIELLTERHTLVLVLEDLHWADNSTVDLLVHIAQRTAPARLLILGTCRPSGSRAQSHLLDTAASQLKLRGRCREIALGLLTARGVAKYLDDRFGAALPPGMAQGIHARTQGNPLFVVTVINSWLANGSLRKTDTGWTLSDAVDLLARGIPDDLRRMIEQQLMELQLPDREIIEAASVAGSGFCPAAIAPALDRTVLDVEARCALMAESVRFLSDAGAHEWPDGTVCQSYQFLHSVHRDVVYNRIPAGRRALLHRQIAGRLEQGYRGHEDEIASVLAMHFSEARDAPRAIHYLQRAAEQSLVRSAHREAVAHLTRALEMLCRLPEWSERARRERDILALLAPALVITRGFADPDAERAYRRAYELSTQLDGSSAQFPVVFGLAVMLEIRGQYPKAQQLMERHMPQQECSGGFVLEARDLLACSRFHQGAFKDALEHGEKGARAFSPDRHSLISAAMGEDPGIDCHTWSALSLWFLGHPDRSLAEALRAVSLAEDPSRSYSLANAQTQLATLHQFRQEEVPALQWADRAIALAGEQGYSYRRAVGQVMRGWALARLGEHDVGIRVLQEGMNGCTAVGAELDHPYHLALLAEAHLVAERPAEAAAVLELALARVADTPAFFYAAEIYRLRGIAALQCRQPAGVAEAWFSRALDVAAAQSALSLELRSLLSLAELRAKSGHGASARARLAKAFARFKEGFESPDLRRAAAFLQTGVPTGKLRTAAASGSPG